MNIYLNISKHFRKGIPIFRYFNQLNERIPRKLTISGHFSLKDLTFLKKQTKD